ncbi:MAG TPA: PDZ domain-containing protein [Terriglobales bacterium]|jgi:membrane-associated protease RseP (regulator of RpoE activity)|nr:PDZ domain-containing protein [Terriglobales bacterium]
MRKPILATLLVLGLLAVACFAAESFSYQPLGDSFGYSSEDFLGGSSYLGVDTRNVTSDRLGALKLKEERGVEITMVDQDAPAGKAGLKEHDVILTVNGTDLESVEQLRRMIHETPPGRVVTLGISRDGHPMTIKVQLADRKRAFAYSSGDKEFNFSMPAMPSMPDVDVPFTVVVVHSSMRSGLMVENLTPQLGDFFGARNGEGVLVRSVDKGSRAEKAGFRAGDVIVRVNGESIHDSGDFSHALRSRKEKTVGVSIIRDRKEQTLTLTLPERGPSGWYRESMEVPDIDADSLNLDLSELRSQMAHLRPQISEAMQQARRAMEDARKSLCQQKEEMRKHADELKKQQEELKEQQEDLKQEMQDQRQDLQEQIRMELHGLSEI